MADSDMTEIPPPKRVVFYKSGNQSYPGVKVAVNRRDTIQSLTHTLSQKTDIGVRSIYTPGASTQVTAIDDLNDGEFYLVSAVSKAIPVDVDQIPNRKVWNNIRGADNTKNGQTRTEKRRKTHSPHPPSDSEHKQNKDTRRVQSHPQRTQEKPKRIVVFKNGDPHMKHMVLLNPRSKYEFENLLMDISDMFRLRLCKLFTTEGFKIESLSAILSGPDLYVAAGATEEFRSSNYIENSPLRSKQNRLRRKSQDNADQPPPKMQRKTRGKWRVWVTTNDNPAAGTDAMVFLSVYGDKGKTDDLVLGCGDGHFEAGEVDEFNVQLGNIGEIYKIRIGHDDNTEFAGWLCDKVEMEDTNTGELLCFNCNRWMSREEDDNEICRELSVVKNDKPVYPVVVYQVSVVTGNLWNAGTSASVYLTIFGERGDTGPRLLYTANKESQFEKGKTDNFTVEAVSLGKLEKIVIGHDLSTAGQGWFLDHVVIKDNSDTAQEVTFPCNRWLDAGEDDGKTNRELTPDTKPPNSNKKMWEQEKWKYEPGNEIALYSQASGGAICIKEDGTLDANGDIKQDQQACVFSVEKGKGTIRKFTSSAHPSVCLAINNNKLAPMDVDQAGPEGEFNLKVQPDRSVAMESPKSSSQVVTVSKSGKPGDVRGPKLGPTKQFHCYVKGMFRDRGIVMFYTSSTQTFMPDLNGMVIAMGAVSEEAHWVIHKVSEGRIRMFESVAQPGCFLRLKDGECDIMGSGSGKPCQFIVNKFRDKGFVTLQSCANRDICLGFLPDGTVQPTVDTEEDNVKLYPAVIKFGTKKLQQTPQPPRKKRSLKAKRAPRNKSYSKPVLMEMAEPETEPEPEPEPEAELETEAEPETEAESESSDGDWQVLVKTGKVGTKSRVVLVVYGDKAVSEPFTLGKGGELFKAGEQNEFKVNLAGIGTIYKIRIGLDSSSKKATWRLDWVKMKDMVTGELLTFKFRNIWVSAKEDDCDVWREMAAVRPGKKGLPAVTYQVHVVTGTEPGSATDANVYLAIHGEQGDTGKRALIKSDKEEKFQEGQVDTFEIKAVSVKKPETVIVGHDGKGHGAGWFLREVIIKDTNEPMMEYVFECNRWLDEGEDDNLIERELELTEVRTVEEFDWKIYVTTGPLEDAGTTSKVALWVYGEKDKIKLDLEPEHGEGFKPGTTEDFRVNLGDIGPIFKIRIGHDNSTPDKGWYLKNVRMVDLFENQETTFEFDRWMSQQHDDKDVWRELPAEIPGKRTLPITRYYVQVFTGSMDDAETTSNVSLNIFGQKADTGIRQLICSKNNKENIFCQGNMDIFTIEAVYLGKLQKVIVGHDGKEPGHGWYLDKILIKDAQRAKNEVYFGCNKWLDAGKGDKAIERELRASKPPTTPDKVSDLAAESTTDTIKLTWKAPSGDATGYNVTCDPPDCSESEVNIDGSKTTRAEFKGLKTGKEYNFAVTTVNGDKTSKEVKLKANTKPNKVVDPVLESTTDTININWAAPEGEFSGYRARISPPDAKRSKVDITDVNRTRVEFTGLTPNRRYKVTIVAMSGETESEKVTVQEKTKPPEIRVLRVVDESYKSTARTITVSWKKPEGDITGYHVFLLPPEGDRQEQKIDKPDKTSVEFKGLKPGQEYTVEVLTVYEDKESETATLTARTEATDEEEEENGEEKVGDEREDGEDGDKGGEGREEGSPKVIGATVEDTTASSITLSWKKPENSNNIKGYRIICAADKSSKSKDDAMQEEGASNVGEAAPAGSQQEIKLYGADRTRAKVNELQEDEAYVLEVFTIFGDDESEGTTLKAVAKANGKGTILQVLDLMADKATDSSITISWTKPEDYDNITGYRVTCMQKRTENIETENEDKKPEHTNDASSLGGHEESDNTSKSPQEIQIEDGDVTSTVFSELKPGKTYIFEVFAVSGDKESEGTILEADTVSDIATATDITMEDTTDSTITISWTKPEESEDITAYRITCSLKGSDDIKDESEEGKTQKDDEDKTQKGEEDKIQKDEEDRTQTGRASASRSQDKKQSPTPLQEIKLYGSDVAGATFSGLQKETTYTVEVFTICGDKESAGASAEATTKAQTKTSSAKKTDESIPKVVDPKVDDSTDSAVTISWTKPDDCDNISAYRITCTLKEGDEKEGRVSNKQSKDTSNSGSRDEDNTKASRQEKTVDGPDVTHLTFGELQAAKTYSLEIFTVLGDKESKGAILEAITKAEGEEHICKVVNAKVENRTESAFTVSWTTPEKCESITAYRLILRGIKEEEDKAEGGEDQQDDALQKQGDEEQLENTSKEQTDKTQVDDTLKEHGDEKQSTAIKEQADDKQGDGTSEEDINDDQADSNSKEQPENNTFLLQEIMVDGSSTTQVTFSELDSGTPYIVEIITVCEDEESEGTIVKATTKKEGEIDGVGDVKVDNTTNSSITISWKKPKDSDSVIAYRITCQSKETEDEEGETGGEASTSGDQEKETASSSLQEIKLYGSKVTRATFHELQAGQSYVLEVFAVSKDMESEGASVEATAEEDDTSKTEEETSPTKEEETTPKKEDEPTPKKQKEPAPKKEDKAKENQAEEKTTPQDIKSQVVDTKVDDTTESSITLSWKKPEDCENITAYRITCKLKDTDEKEKEVKVDDADTTTATFDDLQPGKEYVLEVFVLVGKEEGEGSSVEAQTTSSYSQVKDPKAESTQDTIDVSWTKPEGIVTSYRVTCTPADAANSEVKVEDPETTSAKFEGLVAGREYQIEIYAAHDDKEGEKVTLKKPTKPKHVVDEKCETVTSTSITLTWTKPEGDLTGYRIDYTPVKEGEEEEEKDKKDEKDDNLKSMQIDKDANKAEVTGLEGSQLYRFDIYAVSGDEESEAVSLKEKTKLDQVTDAKTTATETTLTVSWSKPKGQLTGYRVKCKAVEEQEGEKEDEKEQPTEDAPSSDEGKTEDQKDVDAETTSVEFEGLKSGTEFDVEVITLCDETESDPVMLKEKTKSAGGESGGEWKVWVTTHDDSKPANNSSVHLVVYGKDGKSDPIILTDLEGEKKEGDSEKKDEKDKEDQKEKEHNFFEPGKSDEFDITLGEIGEIYKIRIGHHHGASWEGWHLKEVKMQDKSTDKEFLFKFDRWMARDQDDFDVVRELPAVTEGDEALPVEVYHVTVHTGNHWAANTDATLWVNLHGDRGDTGKRILYHSLTEGTMFLKDRKDVFKVEAVSLGELKMVEVGHDGIGYGAGIFVQSVAVKQSENAEEEYYFQCSKWLDDHMDDRKTERQLSLLGIRPVAKEDGDKEQPKSEGNWQIFIKTSDMEDAGTAAKASITLCGDKDSAEPKPLECEEFEQNSEKEFEIAVPDIGEITKIRLEHDNSGDSPNWHVEKVKLVDLHSKEELVFLFNTWLATDKGEEFTTLKEVPVLKAGIDPPAAVKYTVHTTTSDTDVGTTAKDVYVRLYGENGDTGKRLLEKSDQEKKFQKGQVDTFSFEALSVGQLQKAQFIIYADDPHKAWFLDKLAVREGVDAKKEMVFSDGEQHIHEGEGGKFIEKLLDDVVEQDVEKDNKESEEKDDGQSASKGKWTVWVTTGKDEGMGTNANLSMEVSGEKGTTEKLPLGHTADDKAEEKEGKEEEKKDEGKEKDENEGKEKDMKFSPGSVQQFDVDVGEIGPLYKIRLTLEGNDIETKSSMFIEKIKMKDQDTNQEFHFFVNRWLRQAEDVKDEGDQKEGGEEKKDEEKKEEDDSSSSKVESESLMIELPAIRPDIPPPEVLKYDIAVQTGDRGSAETEAEIYLTLFGEKGDSGKRQLLRSKTGSVDIFERGQVDHFTLEAVDLKKLQRIVVGHTAEGYGAGWYLEKITVKESAEATSQYVFPCNRWLDSEMEDRKLERELNLLGVMPSQPETASPDPNQTKSKGQWKVFVKTGDQPDASTKGKVMIVVYGEKKQKTGSMNLEGSEFEAGKEAEFELNIGDIGAISKIQMELEDSEGSPSWYLEKVRMKDADTEEELEFKFDKWLSKDKEDSQMCYKSPAIREGEEPLKFIQYQLSLHTGEKENSDTDGEIYVKLSGDRGRSTRQLLHKSNNEKMFQKGQVDIFTMEAVDPGRIHSIQIENTSKDPKQAWFLEKATIKVIQTEESEDKKEEESGDKKEEEEKKDAPADETTAEEGEPQDKELVYLCQRWIGAADAETDELKDADSETTLFLQENFKCKVVTSDLPECGTDSKVSLTICGDLGRSEVITLDNGQTDNFQPGKTAEFDLQPWPYVGNLTKLRVELTNEAPDEKSWHLKEILLEDCITGHTYTFDFNCWLSRSKEDSKDIVAEMPALVGNQDPLQVIPYQLQVFTGKEDSSATDSSVYLTIYGNQGDTGKRKLHKNNDGEKPFDKPEKKDVFTLDAVSVGKISKIAIHKEGGSQWFLDRVVVKEGQFFPKEMEFKHDNWIGDKDKPDEACDIEIPVTETRPSETTEPLPEGETPPETKGKWEVFITTGSSDDADTDVPVKLTVFGSQGTSDAMVLGEDIPEKFRIGATDRFEVSVGEIGRIEKIQLEQDSGNVDDWIIEKVKMVDMDTKATFTYKPRCWLDWNQGPGQEEYRDIALEIPAIWPEDDKKVLKYMIKLKTSTEDNADTTANAYITIHGEKGHTGVRQLRKSDNEALFQKGQTDLFEIEAVDLGSLQKVIIGHDGKDAATAWLIDEVILEPVSGDAGVASYSAKCDKWLSVEAEDKLTERELMLSGGLAPKSGTDDENWKAYVTTGSDEKASTKAQVMITVYGDRGKSDDLLLGNSDAGYQGYFEVGKTDEFPLQLDDLGKLYKIRLSHDNSGDDASWYPEKVVLEEIASGKQVTFPCGKWMSRDHEDGEVIREFASVHEGEEPMLPTLQYQVQITTGDDHDAGTESNIYLVLYGEQGDTGKRPMRIQGQDKVVFEKDATQTFTLEAVSLGAVTKCIVGHNGKEPGSGMYLKKITVKESAEATEEEIFMADRWLDIDKDDNKIEVELQVYKESSSPDVDNDR